MATTDAAPKTSEVSVAEAKARLSELLRRVELSGEQIVITRRGKAVAMLQAAPQEGAIPERGDWVSRVAGLFADYPDVCEELDRVYADRQNHMPRDLAFPWDDGE